MEVDLKLPHEWGSTEQVAHDAFVRKYQEEPQHVVQQHNHWMAGPSPVEFDSFSLEVKEETEEIPRVITPARELTDEQEEILDKEEDFADGAVDMVEGVLLMTQALVWLKEDKRYLHSPLVEHYEETPGWKDYLRELVADTKEKKPEVQISMSGLQNLLWRWKTLVEQFGFEPHLALGAHETMVRQIRTMAKFSNKTGEPIELKDGFKEELLPVPPDCLPEDRLKEGLKIVIGDALSQPVINTKMFDDYRTGTGKVETKVCFQVCLDDDARIQKWTAFVQKFDSEGKALKDYAVNLLQDEWPCEVTDKLIDLGWNVEYE